MDEEYSLPEFTLLESAIAMHEMYTNYIEAGFTESQALYILVQVLRPRKDSD